MNDLVQQSISSLTRELGESPATINSLSSNEDVALVLESMPIENRLAVWQRLDLERKLGVLLCLRLEPRDSILAALSLEELDALFDGMYADQLIDLSETLSAEKVERALQSMDEQQVAFFEKANQFQANQIGHWVNHNLLMLPATSKVKDSVRQIKRRIPSYTDSIFYVNRNGQFQGAVSISHIITSDEIKSVKELFIENYPCLHAEDDIAESARKLMNSGYANLPVVDKDNVLVGRLDVPTANSILSEFYEAKMMARSGLDEKVDLFAPVRKSIEDRSVWLGINLLTALLASWFVGLFQDTLEAVVALAVLMPVVASMGGIAGSQTLALIIRGLALGQVNSTNIKTLLNKEVRIAAFTGVCWAICVAIIAGLWFDGVMIGLVIALAILANILAASVSGLLVPVILNKLKFDPALSGAVILTTITDIVGFVTFLGLGSLLLV
ncbi:magnesium transporter [Litoribacillus peritrichatus]|uniref:Magnesium transporter n=1 Tax=Litoribacillus peritrichatus TaxID=718191 RepID=A0ABP7MU31_9GAMM